jgi:hypothetical protein
MVAWAAASRAEHERNIQQIKRDTDRVRRDIKAIDRKYGRGALKFSRNVKIILRVPARSSKLMLTLYISRIDSRKKSN